MSDEDLRQRLINILWKYEDLSEGEINRIVDQILKEIKK